MKFLRNLNFLFTAVLFLGLCSCESEEISVEENIGNIESIDGIDNFNSEITTEEVELSKEEILMLNNRGLSLPTTTVTRIHSFEEGYGPSGIIVDDIFITDEQLNLWKDQHEDIDNSKLWIQQSRVSFPANGRRNLTFGVVNQGGVGALNQAQINGAVNAVQRYNALNMNKLAYTSIVGGSNLDFLLGRVQADTFLRSGSLSSGDGQAQFPSFGNPGRIIILDPRTRNFDQNVLAVLIQHEIGHSLGLRHSDFATRRSCGQSGESSSGSEVIPGTNSSGNIINSIMRACGFGQFGNFRNEDINSLRTAYSGISF